MESCNAFTGVVRRCVDDYGMIAPGDRVAVGVSGGKDSLVLLAALAHLRRYYPCAVRAGGHHHRYWASPAWTSPAWQNCARSSACRIPACKTDIREIVL